MVYGLDSLIDICNEVKVDPWKIVKTLPQIFPCKMIFLNTPILTRTIMDSMESETHLVILVNISTI